MWSLIIITVVSLNPPSYYYHPAMLLDSLEKCEQVAYEIRKVEIGKPVRIICARSNLP